VVHVYEYHIRFEINHKKNTGYLAILFFDLLLPVPASHWFKLHLHNRTLH